MIEDSNDYFTIRNVTIYNVGTGGLDAALKLVSSCNGTIINNTCSNNGNIGNILGILTEILNDSLKIKEESI